MWALQSLITKTKRTDLKHARPRIVVFNTICFVFHLNPKSSASPPSANVWLDPWSRYAVSPDVLRLCMRNRSQEDNSLLLHLVIFCLDFTSFPSRGLSSQLTFPLLLTSFSTSTLTSLSLMSFTCILLIRISLSSAPGGKLKSVDPHSGLHNRREAANLFLGDVWRTGEFSQAFIVCGDDGCFLL